MNPDLAAIVSEMRDRVSANERTIAGWANRIESALHSQAQEREGFCSWTSDSDEDFADEVWHSSCGVTYQFTEEGPSENGHKFCHGCGLPLVIAAAPTGGSET